MCVNEQVDSVVNKVLLYALSHAHAYDRKNAGIHNHVSKPLKSVHPWKA